MHLAQSLYLITATNKHVEFIPVQMNLIDCIYNFSVFKLTKGMKLLLKI